MVAVSIIVPLYNKGPYIEETVTSVRQQSIVDFELLIVDNGSTDSGPDVVRQLQHRDRRIVLLNSPRQGPGAARNFGLDAAVGDWIQFLDADDLLETDHLLKLLTAAANSPQAEIVAGGWKEFSEGSPHKLTSMSPAGRDGIPLLDSAIAAAPWAVHAVLIRKHFVIQRRWPESLDRLLAEDIAFWFQLCLEAQIVYSDSETALYRTQTESCRTQIANVSKWFSGVNAAVEFNLKSLEEKGQAITAGQCAVLMRLYSDLLSRAEKSGDSEHAQRAGDLAEHWLTECFRAGHRLSPVMMLRKAFGIRSVERFKRLIGR